MNAAEHIIDRLGGTRRAAVLLSVAPSTVQSWKNAGFIPARRQAEIIEIANRNGIFLTADEMVGKANLENASQAAA
jgi:DNA-binding transcriptional regulator YdaS (Cro superfamily)